MDFLHDGFNFRCDFAGSCGKPAQIFLAGVIPAEQSIIRDCVARCPEHAPMYVSMVRGSKVQDGPAFVEHWNGEAWVAAQAK